MTDARDAAKTTTEGSRGGGDSDDDGGHGGSRDRSGDVIGHGTWLDKLAYELVRREESLGRDTGMITVESGLGASGIPHIGSLGDAARAYGVKLALGNLGYDSKLVAYSDDLDGLRKVPDGLPASLEEHLARPVSLIPDPFSCHDSYGMHMSSILLDGLDRVGIKYEFRRAYDTYRQGLLRDQIHAILCRSAEIGEKIAEMVGQSKYQMSLPYFPVCESCSRLYTAQAVSYDESARAVSYECRDTQMAGRVISGCGHSGSAKIDGGSLGKLAWKVEFAARWAAFDVRFEAYGKDIMDSVKVNDWVAEHVLGYAHPHHTKYEMFLDKGGKKISKSAGNVLTAQRWLEFGSPQSILLLLYKRIAGARELGICEDIPSLMDEFNELEDVYFGRVRKELRGNPAKLAKTRGLYLYANLLRPPERPGAHVGYMLAVKLARVYRTDRTRRVVEKLLEYGVISEPSPEAEELVRLAGNYADEFDEGGSVEITVDDNMRAALVMIARMLDSGRGTPDDIQTGIYDAAKSCGAQPKDVFAALYQIILGSRRGPRLGPFIADIGKARVSKMITERVT